MNSDMTKYCYQHFENAYNIGWNTNFDSTVESKETFNSIFIEKLTSYCENPLNSDLNGVYRETEIDGKKYVKGFGEIRIIDLKKKIRYAAPNVIIDDILSGKYIPPIEFIDAVLTGPTFDSEEYQEFYRWIREDFGADAVIHFGTHGTLEFLPGKETGMTGACWPDRLIGDVPHFYYYYIGNPSEAMVAKRRALATLISYQAPPLKKSGLYGTYQELKETIAEYRESQQSAPERCGDLLEQIGKLAAACEGIPIPGDGLTAGELDAVEEQLYTYENSLITDGLHCLNEEESRGILHALDGKYLPGAANSYQEQSRGHRRSGGNARRSVFSPDGRAL